jgi:phage tail sheath protein FI
MNDSTDYYYEDVINETSNLIWAKPPGSWASPPNPTPSNYPVPFNQPSPEDGLTIKLEDGGDGVAPDPIDYVGVDNGPGDRTGIQALGDIDYVSIVAVPGITDRTVQNAMINQCELMMDRFAILDSPANKSLGEIQDHRSYYDSKYAAIYYPLIKIRDPLTGKDINIPPSGHIAGIYARSDIERGVHKAPANEVIRGITGLEKIVNKGEQDILNPKPNHINVLRDFRGRGRGYRVWGARCITSDPDWKYINVRRLFIFVEESIEEGTQWVVFEPNDEPTWARVRRSVTNFLYNIWRDGALQGQIPGEAFFVRCDRTTMTQTDIDNGKLIMEIGIAPVKPAEFVIFRIGQWTGGSEIQE